jgi:hypothetical protein
MSTNNKEPGESLALILFVVALCVIGWTLFVPFTGLFYQAFRFLPRLFGFRFYYQQWPGVVHFPQADGRILIGVLIALVLFALGAIIKAINANTRELRKIREDLKTTASK